MNNGCGWFATDVGVERLRVEPDIAEEFAGVDLCEIGERDAVRTRIGNLGKPQASVEVEIDAPNLTVAAPGETAGLPVSPTGAPAPAGHPLSQQLGPLKDFMREQELSYVNRALALAGGDKEKAAQLLNVSVATLYRKLADEEMPA